MPIFAPSTQELIDALPHIRYEISSFLTVPEFDRTDFHITESVQFRRMAHARSLMDFFGKAVRSNNPKDDDILATDYGFPSQPIFSPPDEGAARDRINKHLMHLTFSRLRLPPSDKLWPIDRLFPPIARTAQAFVRHILDRRPVGYSSAERQTWEAISGAFSSRTLPMEATANVAHQGVQTMRISKLSDDAKTA
jgi:hypothetical protein